MNKGAWLSVEELSEAIGVSRRGISRYVKAGCPHERTGNGARAPLRFKLDKVKRWMKRTARTGEGGRPPRGLEAASVAPPKPRAEIGIEDLPLQDLSTENSDDLIEIARRVNIEIKRLEVQKRSRLEREAEGELVPLEDVKRAWAAQIEIVQARFRALPALLASRLVGKDYDAMRDALEDELRKTLIAFAREELAI